MAHLTGLQIIPAPLDRLAALLAPDRAKQLRDATARGWSLLEGRAVRNVNSTTTGGGVAEMLATLLAYGRGAGVDTRWLVIGGDAEFFTITKRLHNPCTARGVMGARWGQRSGRTTRPRLRPIWPNFANV